MFYAGIGARDTPKDMLDLMANLSRVLYNQGYILRSGGAKGADSAFESECCGAKEIFRPNGDIPDWAFQTVYKYHPNPMNINDYGKKCHARNAQIILGGSGDVPALFVVCWTKDGGFSGGTGQALRIAKDNNIPIYNVRNKDALVYVKKYIKENNIDI